MRLGIFSDTHANYEALSAVYEAYKHESVDDFYSLGDTVGYGGSPNECSDLVRSWAQATVLGNHDAAVAGRMDYSYYYEAARTALDSHARAVSEENMQWLCDLEYEGSTYRLNVESNRDVLFTVDHDPSREADLLAVPHILSGTGAGSILAANSLFSFWSGTFNGEPPFSLTQKRDALSFDIDGLEEALESLLCEDHDIFLEYGRSIGFTGQWDDRQLPDSRVTNTYLIAISIP